MAPCRSVNTLLHLSLSSCAKLVTASVQRIEKEFQSRGFDKDACRDRIQLLQDFLRPFFPATLWEKMFHSVEDLYNKSAPTADCRFLYSLLIFKNVDLAKLKLPKLLDRHRWWSDKLVAFWMRYLPMLSNIKEVDLHDVEREEVICAFSETCTDLEVICLSDNVSDRTMEIVMQNRPNLRAITCTDVWTSCCHQKALLALERLQHLEYLDWMVSGEWLTEMKADRPLRLKMLKVFCHNSDEVRAVVNVCPDLKQLDIYILSDDEDIDFNLSFDSLASSKLQLSKLILGICQIPPLVFKKFFISKGLYLTDLSLILRQETYVAESLPIIGAKCPNLTKLTVDVTDFFEQRLSGHLIPTSFPKLEQLCIMEGELTSVGMDVADYCLAYAENVTTFNLLLRREGFLQQNPTPVYENKEDRIVNLLRNNRRVKMLTTLSLDGSNRIFGMRIAQNVFECCTELECLEIGPLDEEAEAYLKLVLGNVISVIQDQRRK